MSALDRWFDLLPVFVGAQPPELTNFVDGALWYDTTANRLRIYYGYTWHVVGSGTFPLPVVDSMGGLVFVSQTPPAISDQYEGDLWYRPDSDTMSIYTDKNWREVVLA
jgi:hypothetical protein